ncbi:MAG: LPS export ABC transporter periplasmic protein LptC [Candidatus Wallbacteria bacterium]|nr:LPS export ABC transporter periplasmic protein LptC [Candidatus Wallbacteria bacterium]
MNNRVYHFLAGLIALFWLFFVFIPYLARKMDVEQENYLIMENLKLKEFDLGRLTRTATAVEYRRNMDNEEGLYRTAEALIFTQSGEVRILADLVEEIPSKSLYTMSGNVQVFREDSILRTDRLIYRENQEELFSPTRVTVTQPGQVTSGNTLRAYPRTDKWYLEGSVEIIIEGGKT